MTFSSGDLFYLALRMLLGLPPIGNHCLMNIINWAYFFLTNILFILILNWIHLFVLDFIIVSKCHLWGFGTYKMGYNKHNYTIVIGILGIE